MKLSQITLILCLILAFSSCNKDCNCPTSNNNTPDDGDNFWEMTNGPYGVNIIDLKINSKDDVFALTNGDGIYKSIDSGKTWNQINSGLPLHITKGFDFNYNLEIDKNNNLYYYESFNIIDTTNGKQKKYSMLYKSIDYGNSWKNIKTEINNIFELEGVFENNIYISYPNNETIYISISKDGGESWNLQKLIGSGSNFSIFFIGSTGKIVMLNIGNQLLITSSDNGDSWSNVKIDFTNQENQTFVDINGNLYLLGTYLLSRSKDDGKTWESLINGLFGYGYTFSGIDKKGNIYLSTSELNSYIFRKSESENGWKLFNKCGIYLAKTQFDSKGFMYIFTGKYIFRSKTPIY